MAYLDEVFPDQKQPQQQAPAKGGFLDSLFPSEKQPQQQSMAEPLVKEGMERLRQRESDIDYSTGAPVSTRMLLQRASNPDEAKKVLSKSVGEGNYGQDRFGQWWIKEGDKRISVLPKGVMGSLKNAFTGMASTPGATAGAIAGGVVGETVFPLGGGIPGAIAGAMVGTGLDDLTKWAQGLFAQKPSEVVSSMAGEGAIAGIFQSAGPLASKAGGAIKSGLQSFTGTTPTTRTMARELSGSGAAPPIGSYAPEATSIEYKRHVRNILAGDPKEAQNIVYLQGRMQNILSKEGIPQDQIGKMMDETLNTSYRLSATEAGTKIAESSHKIHTDLLNDYTTARAEAETMLRNADTTLRQLAQAPPELGQSVADAIVGERRKFSKQMTDVYKSIDRMTGDRPIVPTDLIRAQAKGLVQIMPPQALPPLLKEWAGKNAPPMITFEQAHALRTTLREMSEIVDVSPMGQKLGNVRKMAGSVDSAMSSTTDSIGMQAAGKLKEADRQYAQGIAKYNNLSVNRLVKDLRSGIVPEPTTTAKMIMNPDNTNLASTVLNMLPPDTRANVIKADLANMVQSATYRTDDGQMLMDGKSFMQQLDGRAGLLSKTYDPKLLAVLRENATQLAAFDGQIDVNSLKTPTAVAYAMQRANGAMRAADEFAKNNPLGAFLGGTPAQIDRALARTTQPGNEATTEAVANTLKMDSPQWRSVRRYAMQKLFANAIVEKESLSKTISGESINQELNRFTKRQQELLFPNGLADDLRVLSKEAKFLFPSSVKNKEAGIVTAGSIKSHLWLNPLAVWNYIRFNVAGYIADHPRLLRFLAEEIKERPAYARGLLSTIGQFMVDRAIEGGPGKGKPGPDVEPRQQPIPIKSTPVQYGGPMQ